jgi:hypothetical protein
MHGRIFHFYEGFNGVRNAQLFHLFDPNLLAYVDAIHRAWTQSVSFGTRYERVRGGDHYIFTVPPNRGWTKHEEKAWAAIEKSIKDLHKAVKDFLQYVRTNYLEIDIDELNETAWKRYVQFQEDFEKRVLPRK